jgi:hypothetical protein
MCRSSCKVIFALIKDGMCLQILGNPHSIKFKEDPVSVFLAVLWGQAHFYSISCEPDKMVISFHIIHNASVIVC